MTTTQTTATRTVRYLDNAEIPDDFEIWPIADNADLRTIRAKIVQEQRRDPILNAIIAELERKSGCIQQQTHTRCGFKLKLFKLKLFKLKLFKLKLKLVQSNLNQLETNKT